MTIEFDGQNNKLGTTTADSVTIKTNDTDAITVDSSQNTTLAGNLTVDTDTLYVDSTNNRVGIGTSSPSQNLEVSGGNPVIKITDTNNTTGQTGLVSNIQAEDSAGTQTWVVGNQFGATSFYIANKRNSSTRFETNGIERARIDSSGTVMISTTNTNPVSSGGQGASFRANGQLSASQSADNVIQINRDSDGGIVAILRSSSAVGSISVTSSSTSFNTSSDYRLKENVVDITGATERLKQLQPKRFNFIVDADTTVDGFLAHEVSSVVPEAISGEKDAMKTEEYEVTPAELDEEGNIITEAVMGTREVPDYQGIDQSKLVPLLTASLKEAIAKIEELETRIEALENV
jgi:hypothetical protein